MSGTKFIGGTATAALLAAGLTAMSGAAKAQDSEQQPTMFGYSAPHQYLINRMMAPDQPETSGSGGQAAGQGGNGGQAAAADDNGPNNGAYQLPRRYLLNRMFDFGGGDGAAAPAASAPAAAASAPAAKTP